MGRTGRTGRGPLAKTRRTPRARSPTAGSCRQSHWRQEAHRTHVGSSMPAAAAVASRPAVTAVPLAAFARVRPWTVTRVAVLLGLAGMCFGIQAWQGVWDVDAGLLALATCVGAGAWSLLTWSSLRDHFRFGDVIPSVVVSERPLRVATFTNLTRQEGGPLPGALDRACQPPPPPAGPAEAQPTPALGCLVPRGRGRARTRLGGLRSAAAVRPSCGIPQPLRRGCDERHSRIGSASRKRSRRST